MKLNRIIFGLACLSVSALTSCYDEKGDDYTPAKPQPGAYLIAENTSAYFASDDTPELTLLVGRTDESVTSVSLACDNDKFSVPSQVTLTGDTTLVKVPFTMQGGTTETVNFTITANGTPYGLNVLSMDVERDLVWLNIGTGTFTSEFFEASWPQDILQAEGTQKYRLPDLYEEGYELAFELTDDGTALKSTIATFQTGYVDGTYGMIRGRNLDIEAHPLVRDGKDITIPLQFVVDAGSFGWANETITLP